MNQSLVAVIILFIGALVIGLFVVSRKTIGKREPYKVRGYGPTPGPPTPGPPDEDCEGVYPPPPLTMPPSAYAKLMTPYIASSADNPEIPPTMNVYAPNPTKSYSDRYVCNTPWRMRAFNGDSCAQFGIGESVQGPPGNQFCVCEAKHKNGKNIAPKTLTPDDVVIAVGGVCSKDSQCCTNNCINVAGQFSKVCQCPATQSWNMETGRCEPNFYPTVGQFSGMYDYSAGEQYPFPASGSALSTGKLCAGSHECGLGEGCTPDNFCASLIAPDPERYAGKFFAGANCTDSSQCANNIECINGTCKCPAPLKLEWSSWECQCSDGSLTLSNGTCIPPSQVPRTMCPSLPWSFSPNIQGCGLGERYNPSTKQCMCTSDLHTNKIGNGGKCNNSLECKTGSCRMVVGVNVCVEPEEPLYDVAVAEYL